VDFEKQEQEEIIATAYRIPEAKCWVDFQGRKHGETERPQLGVAEVV
jgi:hypothetical protein